MPEIICTTVYQFPELSDAAKEKARSWYRELGPHDDWWDAVYEDFERICEILGIRVTNIWFSGFWSQGDGACFEGSFSYATAAPAHIRDYAPQDTTLHGIADRLQAIQRENFYRLAGEIYHRGHYYHEYTMSVEVPEVAEVMRDLARWLYRQLEAEYEYLTSDEALEENIIANEYTFTENGERFG